MARTMQTARKATGEKARRENQKRNKSTTQLPNESTTPFKKYVPADVPSCSYQTTGTLVSQSQRTSSPVTHSALESNTSQSDLEMVEMTLNSSTHQPIFPNASRPSTRSASVMRIGDQERLASKPPRLQSTVASRSKISSQTRAILQHAEATTTDEKTKDESEKLWKKFLRSEIKKNKMKMQLMEEQLRQLRGRAGN